MAKLLLPFLTLLRFISQTNGADEKTVCQGRDIGIKVNRKFVAGDKCYFELPIEISNTIFTETKDRKLMEEYEKDPDDGPYYIVEILRSRELCKKYGAVFLDLDFSKNTSEVDQAKKALQDVHAGYPIDCTYHIVDDSGQLACEDGPLKDDDTHFVAYVPIKKKLASQVTIFPFQRRHLEKGTFRILCRQPPPKKGDGGHRSSVAIELVCIILITITKFW